MSNIELQSMEMTSNVTDTSVNLQGNSSASIHSPDASAVTRWKGKALESPADPASDSTSIETCTNKQDPRNLYDWQLLFNGAGGNLYLKIIKHHHPLGLKLNPLVYDFRQCIAILNPSYPANTSNYRTDSTVRRLLKKEVLDEPPDSPLGRIRRSLRRLKQTEKLEGRHRRRLLTLLSLTSENFVARACMYLETFDVYQHDELDPDKILMLIVCAVLGLDVDWCEECDMQLVSVMRCSRITMKSEELRGVFPVARCLGIMNGPKLQEARDRELRTLTIGFGSQDDHPRYEAVNVPEMGPGAFTIMGIWLPLREDFGCYDVEAIFTDEKQPFFVI